MLFIFCFNVLPGGAGEHFIYLYFSVIISVLMSGLETSVSRLYQRPLVLLIKLYIGCSHTTTQFPHPATQGWTIINTQFLYQRFKTHYQAWCGYIWAGSYKSLFSEKFSISLWFQPVILEHFPALGYEALYYLSHIHRRTLVGFHRCSQAFYHPASNIQQF